MGVATLLVLIGSNVVISMLKTVIPKKVRIPCYIVIIASFVTIIQMLMKAYAPPSINDALGLFIPLIVVNCIVLGRAEAFAAKNTIVRSIADAVGMGLGFTLTLVALGGVREFLCNGSFFDIQFITAWDRPFLLMVFAPGAFIVLGFFLAFMNKLEMMKAKKEGRIYTAPDHLSCSSCRLCNMNDID
jgi:electron transport complex protein RnfE